MSLDEKLVKEAEEQFHKDFKKKIEDLGYHLAYGITMVEDEFAICARVHDIKDTGFPEGIKEQVGNILPKTYSFKGEEIHVKTVYVGKIVAR